MSLGTVLFTMAHFFLFVYTRKKYVRKYKKAVSEKATADVQIKQLTVKLSEIQKIVDAYE